jgi:hypothetical protein
MRPRAARACEGGREEARSGGEAEDHRPISV